MIDSGTFLLLIAFSWLVLLIIIGNRWVNLNNPEIGFGYALFRTQKFNSGIDKVTNVSKRFWRFFFDIGLLVSLAFLLAAVLLFSINLIKFIASFNLATQHNLLFFIKFPSP